MKCFDTRIHSETRSIEELKRMASEGVKGAIGVAYCPIVPLYAETLIDLFRKLV